MKKYIKSIIAVCTALALCCGGIYMPQVSVKAENPIVQTIYTADPSPLVVGDTIYVYTTHDERRETKSDDWSLMNEWRCFSSKDMVNWTDHGQIAHPETFDGTGNWRAWAQHVVKIPVQVEGGRWEDRYYLFAPFNGTKIDVAVSENPWGPFEDATPGKYLIDGDWGGGNIDPAVYIEDHGRPDDVANYDIYLYWGNPYLRYCKLTNDLLDVDPDTDGDGVISDEEGKIDSRFSNADNRILGEVRPGLHSFQIFGDEGYEAFGEPTQGKNNIDKDKNKFPMESADELNEKRCAFEEGPWLTKHDDGKEGTDDYFLFFVGGRIPGETVEYSSAPTPIGPWTYRGLVMDRENGYSCIHPGVAEFKGHNYLFYLNEMLVGGTGSDRSVCVKEFFYDENNLIVKETDDNVAALLCQGIEDTTKGTPFFSVEPVDTFNPYEINEAETICWTSNLAGAEGGFNGTGLGVKTKAKEAYTETDPVTGKEAFWQSAARYGVAVCDIDDGDYIKVANVDFGDEDVTGFKVYAACGVGTPLENPVYDDNGIEIFNPESDTVSGNLELWLDYGTDEAKFIGTVNITDTGSTNTYQEFQIDITEDIKGIHDLYMIGAGQSGAKLFNLDTWQFTKKEKAQEPDNNDNSNNGNNTVNQDNSGGNNNNNTNNTTSATGNGNDNAGQTAGTTASEVKQSIKIKGKKTVKAGKSIKLTAELKGVKGKVKWSVNKKKLAKLTNAKKKTVKLKAIKAGKVKVTAKVGKVKGTITIKIKK